MDYMSQEELEARKNFRPPAWFKDSYTAWETAWRWTHAGAQLSRMRKEDKEIEKELAEAARE